MKLFFTAKPENVLKFMIYCVFLLYLVAIAILNLHYFSTEGYFWGLNPIPAFGPEFLFTTIVFFLLAVIASILSVSSFIIKREKGFGFGKPKEESDGYEKMKTEKDVKKKFKNVEKVVLADKEYKHGGVPMILNEKEAWVNDSNEHTIVIGATGSGKTECAILPTVRILAKAGESIIVTDPKGEIYQRTGSLLKSLGYNIIMLNFRDPLRGNAWNPFTLPYKFYKEGKRDKAMELLEDLANNILIDPEVKGGDSFWQDSACNYFSGLSIGLFEDAEEEQININSINLMATQGEERSEGRNTYDKEYFNFKDPMSSAYVSASTVINAPNETKGGIMSTFRSKTRIFSSRESLSEMLGHTDVDFSKIGKEKTAVFMTIHDEKKTYHGLMTILIKQIYESLIDEASHYENKRLPIRTNFLLDEFPNMPALKDVDSMVTASRSRAIRFTFIIQNFSQLNKTYGPEVAETVKGNCNIHYLLTTELKALEEISKLCGDKKPLKAKEGMPTEPIRPLVTISDLQHMKKFEFLIKRLRESPFKSVFKGDYELTETNAWNCNYDVIPLKEREPQEVRVFDMIKFVKKKREEMGNPIQEPMGSGFGGGLPFGAINGSGFNPFMPKANNFQNVGGTIQHNGSVNPSPIFGGNFDLDEISKQIDAKIAELEAQEKAEKEESSKDIVEIEPEKIEKIEEIEEEKPKINVDVDSIVVDDNITDDSFFDDFFDE